MGRAAYISFYTMARSQYSHIDIDHHGWSWHERMAIWYFCISVQLTSTVTLYLAGCVVLMLAVRLLANHFSKSSIQFYLQISISKFTEQHSIPVTHDNNTL